MDNSNLALRAKHKIVFLGDTAVGKTSLIHQFMYGTFDTKHNTTIGIDYLSKIVNTESKSIRLQIWDTAGQERFRALIPSYIRDASAIVIVFDVTQRSSFDNLQNWINNVRDVRGDKALIMIAGNKIDLTGQRRVTTEEAESRGIELNIAVCETSASSGENVNYLFRQIAEKLPDHQPESIISQPRHMGSIKIDKDVSSNAEANKANKCSC